MAKALLSRIRNSAALTAPNTPGILPEDEYPTKPHPALAHDRYTTDLDNLHEFLATEEHQVSKLDPKELKAWEEETMLLEQRYFFTASTDNKWSEYTFEAWQKSLVLLVLRHVVQIQRSEGSSSAKDGMSKLYEPSRAKTNHKDEAFMQAAKFCPEILYKHALKINEETIDDDLDAYARLIHPGHYVSSTRTIVSNPQWQSSWSIIQTFKDNTKAQIERVNAIISYEVERLILAVMPHGDSTNIFRMLVHEREKYIQEQYANEHEQRVPYNVTRSFEYLKDKCTGTNERMSVLLRYTLINHERQHHQNVLDWSRSFLQLQRAAGKFGNTFSSDQDKRTFYHDPFVGQLTSAEMKTLNAGSFLIDKDQLFDVDRLESYVSSRLNSFPMRFTPDKRTKDFIENKKKLFASVYPKQRTSPRKRKRTHTQDTSHNFIASANQQQTFSRSHENKGKVQWSRQQTTRQNYNTSHNSRDKNSYNQSPRQWNGNNSKHQQRNSGNHIQRNDGNRNSSFTGDSRNSSFHKGHSSYTQNNRFKRNSSNPPLKNHNNGSNVPPRQDRDRQHDNKKNNNFNPAKGQGNQGNRRPPRNFSTTWNRSSKWCSFCNMSGHTLENCYKRQRIRRSREYRNVMMSIPEDQHDQMDTVIDAVGNDYCTVCCDPNCAVTSDCMDPYAQCPNGPNEDIDAARTILLAEESAPLLHMVEQEKGVTQSDALEQQQHENDTEQLRHQPHDSTALLHEDSVERRPVFRPEYQQEDVHELEQSQQESYLGEQRQHRPQYDDNYSEEDCNHGFNRE